MECELYTATKIMAEGSEALQASLDELVQFNTYMKKYLTLRKRCEQMQQVNKSEITFDVINCSLCRHWIVGDNTRMVT